MIDSGSCVKTPLTLASGRPGVHAHRGRTRRSEAKRRVEWCSVARRLRTHGPIAVEGPEAQRVGGFRIATATAVRSDDHAVGLLSGARHAARDDCAESCEVRPAVTNASSGRKQRAGSDSANNRHSKRGNRTGRFFFPRTQQQNETEHIEGTKDGSSGTCHAFVAGDALRCFEVVCTIVAKCKFEWNGPGAPRDRGRRNAE